MKRTIAILLSAVLALGAVSCSEDEPEQSGTNQGTGQGGGQDSGDDGYVEEDENDPSITHDFDITDKNLVFYDDFNQKSSIPRKSRWELCKQGSPAWTVYLSERYDQAYVDPEKGELVLRCENAGTTYLTGGVQMKADKSFKYGKVEVKARFSQSCQGGWPAIWMMPSEPVWSGWPQCGEIDIMERLNHDTHIHHVIHTNYTDVVNTSDNNSTTVSIGSEDGYNVYGIEWSAEKIDFYVNGEKTFSYPKQNIDKISPAAKQWPFDTKFYLILNHAGGAGWPGGFGNDLPGEMRVDWVRVYKLDN